MHVLGYMAMWLATAIHVITLLVLQNWWALHATGSIYVYTYVSTYAWNAYDNVNVQLIPIMEPLSWFMIMSISMHICMANISLIIEICIKVL